MRKSSALFSSRVVKALDVDSSRKCPSDGAKKEKRLHNASDSKGPMKPTEVLSIGTIL